MPWTKIPIDESAIDTIFQLKSEGKRAISYRDAIKEALTQALEIDERVFIMGEGVDDAAGVYGTTLCLHEKFGGKRVFDIPLAENGMTGVAIGAALAGMRPIFVHMRMDFLLLSMDQIINHAAKWRYMFSGRVNVPLVIRTIIGRGWGSAAQHSQSLQALFMHAPGLKVVMPSTPYDVKGLLIASIADENPVVFIEHRWLYNHVGYVPEDVYAIPIGKGIVRKEGKDVTVVGISQMAYEAIQAAEVLQKEGIDVEIVDPRTLKPLDDDIIFDSVKKTGRLVIADTGWMTCGAGAEIAARVVGNAFSYLKAPILRIACPDTPTPASSVIENAFYPKSNDIVSAVRKLKR
jgi:pyruvate dehydrogenase E1 component beta subunit